MKILLFTVLLLLFLCVPAFAAGKVSNEERILQYTAAVLKDMNMLPASRVHEIVQSKDPSYVIVSLQTEAEYKKGHVPGAVHLPINLASPEEQLKKLPKDKTIILVSANGQEACKIAVYLRQQGYKANPMLLGMSAYNRQYAGGGAYTGDTGAALSTAKVPFKPHSNTGTYSVVNNQTLIAEKTKAYAAKNRPFNIKAADIAHMGDVVMLSLQSPEDYANAHIPGTINIPGTQIIAGDKRLLRLPKDKKIIVSCYIGHYSSVGTILLNQMGYEAYSLEWGLAGWNLNGIGEKMRPVITGDLEFDVE